jgi:hypothetical protein
MQSMSGGSIKRLGDLLLEAGFISQFDLERAVDISRKSFQALGKVLVSSKMLSQQTVNDALEMQKVCKIEGMSGSLAVRALNQMREHGMTVNDALRAIGWQNEQFRHSKDPEDVIAAKSELRDQGTYQGLLYAMQLVKIGEAYQNNGLWARAEMKYDEAVLVLEESLPESACELAATVRKLGTLAVQQRRFAEARTYFEQAQLCLEGTGNRSSEEFFSLLSALANLNLSRRKFTDAEKNLKEGVLVLESLGKTTEDPRLVEAIKLYASASQMNTREPDKLALGELLIAAALLSEETLKKALDYGKESRTPLGRSLVTLNLVSEEDLHTALQVQILVRNGEMPAQLGIWLVRYAAGTGKNLDEMLDLFSVHPKSRDMYSNELKEANDKLHRLEKELPHDSQDIGYALGEVARIYFMRQQWIEADLLYKRAFGILGGVQQASSPETMLRIMDQYCEFKAAEQDFDETIRLSKLAMQLRAKQFGQVSIPYAKGIEQLAMHFCNKDDHQTAIGCYDRALIVREKLYGTDDRELISCLESKGDCCRHLNDLLDAIHMWQRGYDIAERDFGPQHDTTKRLREKLLEAAGLIGDDELLRKLDSASRSGFIL